MTTTTATRFAVVIEQLVKQYGSTHQPAGVRPRYPLWISYLVMTGGAAVFAVPATRLSRWDTAETR